MVVRWLTWGGLTTDGTGWERMGGWDAVLIDPVAGGLPVFSLGRELVRTYRPDFVWVYI